MMMFILLSLLPELDARGGGGRGGGRGGAGRSISRTPSMSRTVPRTNSTSVRQAQSRMTQRPVSNQVRRNQVLEQAQSRQLNRDDLSQRARQFNSNQLQEQERNRNEARNLARHLDRERPGYNQWFGNDFNRRHNLNPNYYNSNVNWWRGARWAAAANWVPWGWSGGIYYDDLNDPIVVTSPDSSTSYMSTQTTIAQPSMQTSDAANWLPLGVFILGPTLSKAKLSNKFLQLALNKDGTISGVYYNADTDQGYPISGEVDRNSQRVLFSASKSNSPIVSTGLYNLTQDQTPVTLYFTNGTKQTWTMLRIEN